MIECLCRDAAKKYRCETCRVKRDNLFDLDWEALDAADTEPFCDHYGLGKLYDETPIPYYYCTNCGVAAHTISHLHEKGSDMSKKKQRNRKKRALEAVRAVRFNDVFETPDAWYLCTGWSKPSSGNAYVIRSKPLSDEAETLPKANPTWDEDYVSACVKAKTWTNHGKLPVAKGQEFKTQVGTSNKICAGWDEHGCMLYRLKDAQGTHVTKVPNWNVPHVQQRFETDWEIVGGPTSKVPVPVRKCNLCALRQPKKNEKTCTPCKDRKTCARCHIKFNDPKFNTKCNHNLHEQYTTGGASKSKKVKTYAGGFSKCRHYHRPVKLPGGFIVHASSMNNKRKKEDGLPDWGLYADWGWKPYWRAEHIDWQDFGIPFDDVIAFEQILVAIEKIQKGEDVEVGCIGGHGRTGTIIAAMRVILGEDANTAILTTRKEYCSHAIETAEQEWWIEWVESAVRGTPLTEKPAFSYADFGYGGGSSYSVGANHAKNKAPTAKYANDWENGGNCSQSAHFYMWLKGHENCTKSNSCKFWETDIKSFEISKGGGKWSENMMKDVEGIARPYVWHHARAKKGGFHPNDPLSKPKSTAPGTKPKGQINKNIGYEVRVPTEDGLGMTIVKVHAPPRKKDDMHVPLRKDGCHCDVCRYVRGGYGAFIMPGDLTDAAIWTKEMDALETIADKAVTARLHIDAGRSVTILLADGKFVESRVSDNWEAEPSGEGLFPFEMNENWQWISDENIWVWIGALSDEDIEIRANLAVTAAFGLAPGIGV